MVVIPSHPLDNFGHKSLTLVMDSEGHYYAVADKNLSEYVVDIEPEQ